MRLITAGSVPFGAESTHQLPNTRSGKPASADVGTSGSSGRRCLANTASGRSLPAFNCPATANWVGNAICTSLASMDSAIGAVPRKLMCSTTLPCISENEAPARWEGEPAPGEP